MIHVAGIGANADTIEAYRKPSVFLEDGEKRISKFSKIHSYLGW